MNSLYQYFQVSGIHVTPTPPVTVLLFWSTASLKPIFSLSSFALMQGLLYFNPPVQVEKLKDEVDGKEKIVNSLLGRFGCFIRSTS